MEPEKLSFSCPACQGVLRVPVELAGVRGPCPNCQTEIVAPVPANQSPAMLVQAQAQPQAQAQAQPAAADPIPPFPTTPPPAHGTPIPAAPAAPAAPPPPPMGSATQPPPQVVPDLPAQAPPAPMPGLPVAVDLNPAAPPLPAAPPSNPSLPTAPAAPAAQLPGGSAMPGLPQPSPAPLPGQTLPQSPNLPQESPAIPPANQPAPIQLPGPQDDPAAMPWEEEGLIPPEGQPVAAESPDPSPADELTTEVEQAEPRPEPPPPSILPLANGRERNQPEKRRKPKTKTKRRKAEAKTKSKTKPAPKRKPDRKPGGLPPIAKIAIPILLLAGLSVGAVKYWPQIQSKLGLGKTSEPTTPPPVTPVGGAPSDPANTKDPSGFEYIGDKSVNAEPITPPTEAKFTTDPDPDPPVEPVAPPPDRPRNAITETDDPGAEARATLERALAAQTVDELAALVLVPERVRPKMEKHYGGESPAVESTSIIYEASTPIEDSKLLNHTFFVATKKQPLRFPVAIEDTADGPKLDWETFIELHDDQLGKFLAVPQSDPQDFHVILVRSHYFGSDVPRLGSKDCFRVSTPIPGSEGYAFIEKDTKIAEECKAFEWDRVCFPIATLQWVIPETGKPYLTITGILQKSWRAKPSGEPEIN